MTGRECAECSPSAPRCCRSVSQDRRIRQRSCNTFRFTGCAGALARVARRVTKVPQRAREERDDPVFVQTRCIRRVQPGEQGASKPGQFWQCGLAEGGHDECALTGMTGGQAFDLQLAICLEYRVGVYRQGGDASLTLGNRSPGLRYPSLMRVLDLMDELQMGRNAGRRGRVGIRSANPAPKHLWR